jgi:hypothetical protein
MTNLAWGDTMCQRCGMYKCQCSFPLYAPAPAALPSSYWLNEETIRRIIREELEKWMKKN